MTTLDILKIGLGGFSAYNYASNGQLQGYDLKIERVAEYAHEDSLIIDKQEIFKEKPSLAVSEPMLNMMLDPYSYDKFSNTQGLAEMLPGLEGSFKTLAALKLTSDKFSGFDYMGAGLYIARWFDKGAKFYNNKCESLNEQEVMAKIPDEVGRISDLNQPIVLYKFSGKYVLYEGGKFGDPKKSEVSLKEGVQRILGGKGFVKDEYKSSKI